MLPFGMELEVINRAIESVRAASAICTQVQSELVSADSLEKKDRSPVTVADYAVQAVVSASLAAAFPDIPLVGEEDASELRQSPLLSSVCTYARSVLPALDSDDAVCDAIDRGGHAGGANGRFWTLDPIDGTKGFLRLGQYAIALALIEDGEVVAGVLGCPNLAGGRLYHATKKRPAHSELIAADSSGSAVILDPSDAPWRFCESVEAGHSDQEWSRGIAEQLGITDEPYRIDSQCKYAAVASGDAAVYLRLPTRADYVEKIWDHAAGSFVLERAGGVVTDIHGKRLDFSRGRTLETNQGIIATNGVRHDEVVEAVLAAKT